MRPGGLTPERAVGADSSSGEVLAAAQENRRVRALRRLGRPVMAGDDVVLAREGERPFGEAALEDRDRLGQTLDPDASRLEGNADGVVLGLVPPGAQTDLQTAAGQHV